MTQRRLAAVSGVSVRAIQKLERIRRMPTNLLSLLRLAFALHVPLETLIATPIVDLTKEEVEDRRARPAVAARKPL